MTHGKGCLGCLVALFGIVGIFLAITISFSFYLIPLAFLLFVGSLILISLALGPSSPSKKSKTGADSESDFTSKPDP